MDGQKLNFLKNELVPRLKKLPPGTAGKWGKMNAQQMVEHLNDFFKVSANKITFPLVTPEEHLPKYKAFLLSDKEFRENTKAPVLPDEPLPLKFESMQAALDELESELRDFVNAFSNNNDFKSQHPVFGELNFEEWVLLHFKHVMHHLKQFGLM